MHFLQEERLVPSVTVDSANRLVLHSAEVVHFTHKTQSRLDADQWPLV